jgi:hypothetical protein
MKIGTVLKAINRHAAIYVCLAVFFALCRFFHHLARLTLEICNTDAHWREWALANDRMMKATALIDWVAAHSWLAIAYVVLVVAVVAFAQVRRHPAWTYWLTAVILCIPCVVYWWPCGCILLNLLGLH